MPRQLRNSFSSKSFANGKLFFNFSYILTILRWQSWDLVRHKHDPGMYISLQCNVNFVISRLYQKQCAFFGKAPPNNLFRFGEWVLERQEHWLCTQSQRQVFLQCQGQVRGYGHITHFLPLPLRGHHFQRATVTQWLDRFQIPGYQMKDMDIVFPLIPNG